MGESATAGCCKFLEQNQFILNIRDEKFLIIQAQRAWDL